MSDLQKPAHDHLVCRLDSAIQQSPHLSGHDVYCREDSGTVVLHGRVRSFFQKQMAQETLKRLDGVERVVNQLEVEWFGSTPSVNAHGLDEAAARS